MWKPSFTVVPYTGGRLEPLVSLFSPVAFNHHVAVLAEFLVPWLNVEPTFFFPRFSSVATLTISTHIIGTILNQLEQFPKQVQSVDFRNLNIHQRRMNTFVFWQPVQITGLT